MGFFLQKWDSALVKNDFPKRLKELRLKADLKIEVLGAMIGVGKSSINRWENGDTFPDYNEIMMIINATKCNGAWLLFGQESMFSEDTIKKVDTSSEDLRYIIDLQKEKIRALELQLEQQSKSIKQPQPANT